MAAKETRSYFAQACPTLTWTVLWFIAVSPSVLQWFDYPDRTTNSEIYAPAVLYVISYVAWACGFSAECVRKWSPDDLDHEAICHVGEQSALSVLATQVCGSSVWLQCGSSL
jgi:hypothetical protein